MINQELAKLAIQNENTPELGQYWQKRYEKFLKNNVFILSEKTESLLEQSSFIDAPVTPYGYLNMPIFVSKNKVVDEVMLQNCIETSVRFLDSILDVINFTPEARQLINQNRKIGLGIVNFEEYLTLRNTASKVEEIDHIGEIISSSSYRASEALAEEKGPCDSWNNLAFIIRPKVFEYWYNSETGEVKSGLDISEEFTSSSLLSSNFEIIPRRNSHILFYPNDVEWQIWSDRDDNSILASSNINSNPALQTPIVSNIGDDDNDYNTNSEQEIPSSNLQSQNSRSDEVIDNANKAKNEPTLNQFDNPPPIDDLPLINPISTLQKKISSWFAIDPSIQNADPFNKVELSKDQSQQIGKTAKDFIVPKNSDANTSTYDTKINLDKEITTQKAVEPIIEVKEITKEVEVIKEVEIVKEVEVIKEIEVVKEVEVIKQVNKPILVQIVVLSNEAKKILVDQNNNLPTIEYNFETDIENEVSQRANQSFDIEVDFMEISSISLFEEQVYIVYQAKVKEINDSNPILHFDFVEALTKEQDTIAYSKSIDRVHRWQQSARIKAQELLKEYNQNTQQQANENESKIIAQKNSFIEELQIRIQKLIDDNSQVESTKDEHVNKIQSNFENLENDSKTQIQSLKSKIDEINIDKANIIAEKEVLLQNIQQNLDNVNLQLQKALDDSIEIKDFNQTAAIDYQAQITLLNVQMDQLHTANLTLTNEKTNINTELENLRQTLSLQISELEEDIQKLYIEKYELKETLQNKIDNLQQQLDKKIENQGKILYTANTLDNQLIMLQDQKADDQNQELIVVQNDDSKSGHSTEDLGSVSATLTTNINTNTMSHTKNTDSELANNQAAFRTSRDKMFMPTLEVETKLGVPVIINTNTNDDHHSSPAHKTIVDNLDPKSPSHAASVLLKLKKLTR